MDANEHRNFETPRPIPLDYGGGDLPSDRRREADALANDFGGWPQITAALTLGALGALLGWLPSSGSAGVATFLGVIGFGIGLFVPLPDASDGWRRWIFVFVCGVVGTWFGWWIGGRRTGYVFGIIAMRVGKFATKYSTWAIIGGEG